MSSFFNRLFNIRQEENSRVILLVVIFFVFITGTAWAETTIESSFYYLVGVSHLSQVFTLHALVSLLATGVYTAFVDRTSNQKLMVWVCAIAAISIGVGLMMIQVNQALAYTILYVLVRAVRTSFVIHWWNYASDFYDSRASKRIVPVINAASRLAVITAGLTIPLLNIFLTPTGIVLLWVMSMLIIAMLSWITNRVLGQNAQPVQQFAQNSHNPLINMREGFQYVSSSSYLRWLALSTFLMVIIFALLNYQGGLIFSNSLKSRSEIANFIGTLNGLTNLILLPVQLFLYSRVVSKIGVGNTNVIFPLGTFLISCGVILFPTSLSSGAFAHFDRNTFRYSIQETSYNLLYNAVPIRVKGRARSFIDGLVLPFGLLASSALLELGKLLPAYLFTPLLLGVPALAYLGCSLLIRRQYSHAMLTLLEQEDTWQTDLLRDDSLSLTSDPAVRNILLKKLVSTNDDSTILLIARLMTETSGTSALPILEMKARESGPTLRAGIIDTLAEAEKQTISPKSLKRFFTSFLYDPDTHVRLSAFRGLKNVVDTQSSSFLEQALQLLQEPAPRPGSSLEVFFELQCQALGCLLDAVDPLFYQNAQTIFQQQLANPDARIRRSALRALAISNWHDRLEEHQHFILAILTCLNESDDHVRLQAVHTLHDYTSHLSGDNSQAAADILKAIQKHLQDPQEQVRLTLVAILRDLQAHPSPSQPGSNSDAQDPSLMLTNFLTDSDPQVRNAAVAALVSEPSQVNNRLTILLDLLKEVESNPNRKDNLKQSMLKVVLCRIDLRQFGDLVDEQIMLELKTIYARSNQLNTLQSLPPFTSSPPASPTHPQSQPDSGASMIICTLLNEMNHASLDAIFDLLAARHGDKTVNRITQSLSSQSSRTRANASEALEALISPAMVKLIIPMFDLPVPPGQTLSDTGKLTRQSTKPMDVAAVFRQLISDPVNETLRAFSAYSLGEIKKTLEKNQASGSVPETSNRRANLGRRANLLDLLSSIDPTTPNEKKPANSLEAAISLQQVNELLNLAQNDESPLVRSIMAGNNRQSAPARVPESAVTNQESDPNATYILKRSPAKPTQISVEPGEPMTASLSNIERIIFLKQVNLFQSMTIEQLKALASICEDEHVTQGTLIFKEDDPGGVVYVVIKGRISIERAGDRKGSVVRLTTLEARDSFGEMNLFENSPRSASAVAIEDSLLLKLRAEPFVDLIRQHPDLSLELIKVLSGRIREANDQIAHLTRSMPRQLQSLYDRLEEDKPAETAKPMKSPTGDPIA